MKLKDIGGVLKSAVTEFMKDDALTLAASVAFYTALSLAPLLLLAVWVVGLFYRDVQEQAVARAQETVGPQGAEIVRTILQNVSNRRQGTIAAIVGFATLLFSASGVFAQLQYSLNRIWNVKPRSDAAWWDWFRKRFRTLVMMGGIALIFLASIVAATALAVVHRYADSVLAVSWFWSTVNQVVPLLLYVFLFAMVFRILPDVDIQWGDVWFGAFITAVLFTIGRYLIGIYLGKSGTSSVYGAAGSLVALLLWLYYSAVIFFFGAELTQAFACARGRHIGPSKHAEWINPQDTCNQP